jgi:hypothetical protein
MRSKDNPGLKFLVAIDDARWHAREAALAIEEGVVWRGADAARTLAERASDSRVTHAADRVRWAIERSVAWPLADALRERGELVRTSIATGAVVAALAAGIGGATLAADGNGSASVAAAADHVAAAGATPGAVLAGVAPNFAPSREGRSGAAPVPVREVPREPTARTAWRFAEAFVLYEVGRATEAADALDRLATPALARSLRESPPRLPASTRVPRARILNVVLGKRKAETAEASVSLVRLEAVSELRLTLRRTADGWRVNGVLG